jgi:predicted negative regulator of RcsB-dependent stress response
MIESDRKTKGFTIWIVAIILILVIGWFYWSQFRPSSIKKQCAKSSTHTYGQVTELVDDEYNQCIKLKGL